MIRRPKLNSKKLDPEKRISFLKPLDNTSFHASCNNVNNILHLQRIVGNHAILRLFRSGRIQTKFGIPKPNDKCEKDVNSVSNQIIHMFDLKNGANFPAEEKGSQEVQLQPDQSQSQRVIASPALTSVINSLKGTGHPLPESLNSFFKPRLGHDFSHVRLHTDTRVNELAKAMNAKAFTIGNDIGFGSEKYSPNSIWGKKLLAHELTHVLQQKGKDKNTIRLWSEKGHKEITYMVGRRLKINRGLLVSLAIDSTAMDKKKILYLIDLTSAPDHGECKGYRRKYYICRNKAIATAINKRRQKAYLKEAIRIYNEYQRLRNKYGGIKWDLNNIRKSQEFRTGYSKNLGDALHVAQDRGAHGEGVWGLGHCRANPNRSTCDNPSVNARGYIKAVENTVELFNDFDRAVIRGIIGSRASFFYRTAIRRGRIRSPRIPYNFKFNFKLSGNLSQRSRKFFVSNGRNIKVTSTAHLIHKQRTIASSIINRRYLIELHGIHYGSDFNYGAVSYKLGRTQYFSWPRRAYGYYYIKIKKYTRNLFSHLKIMDPRTDIKGQVEINVS